MNTKKSVALAAIILSINLSIMANANAETVTVKCISNTEESNISVIGTGHVAALWRASIRSGTAPAVFSKLPLKRTVNGEVEYDFSSNLADIRRGETPILATFVKNKHVTGNLYKVSNTGALTLVGSVTATCKVK